MGEVRPPSGAAGAAPGLGRRAPYGPTASVFGVAGGPEEVGGAGDALDRPVRGVLFDLDDTLFDHALTCRDAIRVVRSETAYLQRRPLDDLWCDYLGMLTSSGVRDPADPRGADDRRPERWRALARSCGELLDGPEGERLSRRYRDQYLRHRRAIAGAVELVRELHRLVPVAVVTNNEVAEQEEKLRFLGLVDAVDALVVSEAVGVAKPDRGIFDQALGRIGVAPPDAVMVGDSWTSDVLGARGLGVRPVWFNRFRFPSPGGELVDELASFLPSSEATGVLLGTAARAGPGGVGSRRGR